MTATVQRADWDARYATSDLVWSAEPNRFVVEECAALPPGRALDLAAGEGRNAVWLAERGWRVTAVDYSIVGLGKARELAARRGVSIETVADDLLAYEPEPGAFDLVLIAYLQLPADERVAVWRRAAAAVAPGGVLVVVAHDRSNLDGGHGGPQDPAVLATPGEVAAALAPVLDVERAEIVERPVETPDGGRVAIDHVVRARRPVGGGEPRR